MNPESDVMDATQHFIEGKHSRDAGSSESEPKRPKTSSYSYVEFVKLMPKASEEYTTDGMRSLYSGIDSMLAERALTNKGNMLEVGVRALVKYAVRRRMLEHDRSDERMRKMTELGLSDGIITNAEAISMTNLKKIEGQYSDMVAMIEVIKTGLAAPLGLAEHKALGALLQHRVSAAYKNSSVVFAKELLGRGVHFDVAYALIVTMSACERCLPPSERAVPNVVLGTAHFFVRNVFWALFVSKVMRIARAEHRIDMLYYIFSGQNPGELVLLKSGTAIPDTIIAKFPLFSEFRDEVANAHAIVDKLCSGDEQERLYNTTARYSVSVLVRDFVKTNTVGFLRFVYILHVLGVKADELPTNKQINDDVDMYIRPASAMHTRTRALKGKIGTPKTVLIAVLAAFCGGETIRKVVERNPNDPSVVEAIGVVLPPLIAEDGSLATEGGKKRSWLAGRMADSSQTLALEAEEIVQGFVARMHRDPHFTPGLSAEMYIGAICSLFEEREPAIKSTSPRASLAAYTVLGLLCSFRAPDDLATAVLGARALSRYALKTHNVVNDTKKDIRGGIYWKFGEFRTDIARIVGSTPIILDRPSAYVYGSNSLVEKPEFSGLSGISAQFVSVVAIYAYVRSRLRVSLLDDVRLYGGLTAAQRNVEKTGLRASRNYGYEELEETTATKAVVWAVKNISKFVASEISKEMLDEIKNERNVNANRGSWNGWACMNAVSQQVSATCRSIQNKVDRGSEFTFEETLVLDFIEYACYGRSVAEGEHLFLMLAASEGTMNRMKRVFGGGERTLDPVVNSSASAFVAASAAFLVSDAEALIETAYGAGARFLPRSTARSIWMLAPLYPRIAEEHNRFTAGSNLLSVPLSLDTSCNLVNSVLVPIPSDIVRPRPRASDIEADDEIVWVDFDAAEIELGNKMATGLVNILANIVRLENEIGKLNELNTRKNSVRKALRDARAELAQWTAALDTLRLDLTEKKTESALAVMIASDQEKLKAATTMRERMVIKSAIKVLKNIILDKKVGDAEVDESNAVDELREEMLELEDVVKEYKSLRDKLAVRVSQEQNEEARRALSAELDAAVIEHDKQNHELARVRAKVDEIDKLEVTVRELRAELKIETDPEKARSMADRLRQAEDDLRKLTSGATAVASSTNNTDDDDFRYDIDDTHHGEVDSDDDDDGIDRSVTNYIGPNGVFYPLTKSRAALIAVLKENTLNDMSYYVGGVPNQGSINAAETCMRFFNMYKKIYFELVGRRHKGKTTLRDLRYDHAVPMRMAAVLNTILDRYYIILFLIYANNSDMSFRKLTIIYGNLTRDLALKERDDTTPLLTLPADKEHGILAQNPGCVCTVNLRDVLDDLCSRTIRDTASWYRLDQQATGVELYGFPLYYGSVTETEDYVPYVDEETPENTFDRSQMPPKEGTGSMDDIVFMEDEGPGVPWDTNDDDVVMHDSPV
jgi:hypothetical protein